MSTLTEGPGLVPPVAAPMDAATATPWRTSPGAPPLGSGRTADVYAWQPGWVLKLFRTEVPRPYVDREMRSAHAVYEAVQAANGAVSSAASGAGSVARFSVPVVGATLMVGARVGLLYAHADGSPLPRAALSGDGQTSGSRPGQRRDAHPDVRPDVRPDLHPTVHPNERFSEHIGERLADLHLAIHRIDPRAHRCLDTLPDQRDWLRLAVETARDLSSAQRSALLRELHSLDYAADSLCHGDFHPYNVLQRPDGAATVIDWVSAARGRALCDVAKTAVRLRFAPAAGQTQIAPAQLAIRRAVHDAYLRRYCERYPERVDEAHGGTRADGDTDAADPRARCQRWLPLAAAGRLVEGVGAAERSDLLAFIQRRLARVPTGSVA